MTHKIQHWIRGTVSGWIVLLCLAGTAVAQQQPAAPGREFPVGSLTRLEELPAGRFRTQLGQLPEPARQRALQWLRSAHFTELDLPSLHADAEGGIFYVCALGAGEVPAEAAPPAVGEAAVPVSPFPAHLIFHSKAGAANVLYLNFGGENVSGTEWNNTLGRTNIPALCFSTDSDYTTFSDAEQLAVKRIWQRVAEDCAPFDIDVTTERPATFTTRTAHALITRNTDANGAANPSSSAAGVAYLNVFGSSSYARYRPAWIYNNQLSNNESYIAEAASHEVGHNFGLSHDGKTGGTEYYGGHGSGDTSWGPIMGTGYGRHVSQWSKGEYYLANNTQDDLATVAGKVPYRADDHGNTAGASTALVLTGGTNVVSTTPENDPANTNTVNKGVLERSTDVDVFSFVTGNGAISLSVQPWVMPSGTRGGNLDVWLELYSDAGVLLLTNNPASQTVALLQTNLAEGRYYLHVRNSGAGDPLSATPTGYTSYASIGQYFISGCVVASTGFDARPLAEAQVTDITQAGLGGHQFTVTYSDDVAVDVSTVDSSDLRILGPNGYDRAAQVVSVNSLSDGTPRVATYAAAPSVGGVWTPADNGTYTIWMRTNQVSDSAGGWVAAGQLGAFRVTVPATLYSANLNVDPGWTLEPQWAYGPPAYPNGGPTSGFTGVNIIGYNLSGNYANNLPTKYATTPTINTSGSSSLTLRFKRWLRTRPNDIALIQVSTNGVNWIDVWSSSTPVSDNAWQEVQYTLPGGVAGSASLRLRWGLSSNQSQNDLGWNLDDIELLGDGVLDTTPPVPTLLVSDITSGGSPSHCFGVTYTDDTAVRLASLDSFAVEVTGPNGYSNLVELVGTDLPSDGTPCAATYSAPAPGGGWDAVDNGVYEVVLLENKVTDVCNNAIPRTELGSFTVSIAAGGPGTLAVSPTSELSASGTVGGPFRPTSFTYTLSNSGSTALDWMASTPALWLSLSPSSGTLGPAGSTNVVVVLNASAQLLSLGSNHTQVSFSSPPGGPAPIVRDLALCIYSLPAWTDGVQVSGGTFQAQLQAVPNWTYVIEASTNLLSWSRLATNQADATGQLNFTDPGRSSFSRRFYRAVTAD